MSLHTPIEWCDSAVNPVMGCDGCELWVPSQDILRCYAGTLHQMRGGNPGYAETFLEPKMFAGRMAKAARWSDLTGTERPDKPWLSGLPRLIFVSDMGDALSKDIPFEFLNEEIIQNVSSAAGRRHQWLWLTKQPGRMAAFSRWLAERGIPWPPNLWAMTSVTSAKTLGRIQQLLEVQGPRIRGISVEPLIGPVEIYRGVGDPPPHAWDEVNATEETSGMGIPEEHLPECEVEGDAINYGNDLVPNPEYAEHQAWRRRTAQCYTFRDGISWCIVGGESGKDARAFHLDWYRAVLKDCRDASVPVFGKQFGANPYGAPAQGWLATGPGDLFPPPGWKPDPAPLRLRDKTKGGDWSEWPEDLRVREFPKGMVMPCA